MDSKTIL